MPQTIEGKTNDSCHAKDGNPFGPFWSHFHIDFDKDVFYKPLYFDVQTSDGWNAKFEKNNSTSFVFFIEFIK